MANIANICKIVHGKVLERTYSSSTRITVQEIFIADNLFALLEDLSSSESFRMEAEETLEIPDDNHHDLDYDTEVRDDEEQQTTESR